MNISFTINLSFDEQRAFGKQCEKEFKLAVLNADRLKEQAEKLDHVSEYTTQFVPGCGIVTLRKDPDSLKREIHESVIKQTLKECRLLKKYNVSRLRAIAIVDIAEAFNLPIDSSTFNEMIAFRGCLTRPKEDKPYYRKLAVYIMYRSGIITKKTRDKLLSLYKAKSAITRRNREQAKLNRIHKCYLKFMDDLGEMVTPQEKRDLWAASGVHAYLVKKYGIEKVCNMCIGGE